MLFGKLDYSFVKSYLSWSPSPKLHFSNLLPSLYNTISPSLSINQFFSINQDDKFCICLNVYWPWVKQNDFFFKFQFNEYHWAVLSHVWLFATPTDHSPPGSSVHGILQARILEWIAYPFSRGSSWPRDWTSVSFTAMDSLPTELPGKPKHQCKFSYHIVDKTRRRQWHPTPVLLPRKSHGWRSLVGCSSWGG